MTLKHFKQEYSKFIIVVFACMLPFVVNSATEEVILEKRNGVAMRMIGHEVLMSLGDCESRILPIEKVGNQFMLNSYRISFEFEFGFDPDEVVTIIDSVVSVTKIASHYLVEVEQCETKEVVHSFEIGNPANSSLIPCRGRVLPEDCYSLLITLLDDVNLITEEISADNSSIRSSETNKSNPFKPALLTLPLVIIIGFVGYFIKKKKTADTDPDSIIIGATRFDKRNMFLSFENNKVELSNKESELLSLLHTSANEPIKREVILQRVWGDEGYYVGRTLDVFISKLRKKLEPDASVKIVNIRGVGYKLVVDK